MSIRPFPANRVILVPGQKAEVATVCRIYKMALKGMFTTKIARELNGSFVG